MLRRDASADDLLVEVVQQWPSLVDQVESAVRLFGPSGPHEVYEWVAVQTAFFDDGDFARTFSDHVQLPGISSLDYAHRHIRTKRGDLLGGIRFYSRNSARPFVDVVAHSFDDIDALAECVRVEWSNFDVRFLRLRTRPRKLAVRPDVILDKTIHAAPCRDISAADGRVTLESFQTAEHPIGLITDRYPVVAGRLAPACWGWTVILKMAVVMVPKALPLPMNRRLVS